MTHAFVFVPSTLSSSMTHAKFLSCPILFENGWNWKLKFSFLGQYGQKTIFQTTWTENTDELIIYLVWFSSTVWRGQFALKFFAQNIWKEKVTKYLCYFHKFPVQDHLHEHFRTFEQFCVVSGLACVALIYLFFIINTSLWLAKHW